MRYFCVLHCSVVVLGGRQASPSGLSCFERARQRGSLYFFWRLGSVSGPQLATLVAVERPEEGPMVSRGEH
jgi:hypothetical protein